MYVFELRRVLRQYKRGLVSVEGKNIDYFVVSYLIQFSSNSVLFSLRESVCLGKFSSE